MSVVDDKGEYSWYNIDRVYDHMLSLGVRRSPVPALAVIPSEIASMLALTLAASAFAPPTLAPRPASAVRAAEPQMVAKQNFGPIKNPGSGVSAAATEFFFL